MTEGDYEQQLASQNAAAYLQKQDQEQTEGEMGLAASGYGLLLNCAFGKASSCVMAIPGAAFAAASYYYAYTQAFAPGASLFNAALSALQVPTQIIQAIGTVLEVLPFATTVISIIEGPTKVQVPFPTVYFNTAYNTIPPNIILTNSTFYNFSPVESVYKNNTAEAPNYLTCPINASPLRPTTDLYFYANKSTLDAGDKCLSKNTTFTSALYGFTTDISVPPLDEFIHILVEAFTGGYITDVTQLQISNPGVLTLQDIGYFPSVDGQLSNGWNTSSYIFDQVPSTPQHSIWSWNLVLANLSNASLPKSSHLYFQLIKITEPGLTYPPPPIYVVPCLYTGPYFEQTTLDSISLNYLPFTETLENYSPINYNSQPRAIFDTKIYPYLLYNYLLSENNSQLANPNLSGMSEDVYSPWNYYNPANAEDQFPVDLPSVLFANSTTHKNDLITLPQNGIGINVQALQTPVLIYGQTFGQASFTTFISDSIPFNLLITGSTSTGVPYSQSFQSSTTTLNLTSYELPPGNYNYTASTTNSTAIQSASLPQGTTVLKLPTASVAYNSTNLINFIQYSSSSTNTGGTGGEGSLLPASYTNVGPSVSSLSTQPITNPIAIASTINNYLYVLYYNNSLDSYSIAVIRLYPHGTYNPTLPLPTSNVTCGGPGSWSISDCGSTWNSEWGNYWDQVINEENNTAYVLNTIPVPDSVSNSGTSESFTPYSIAADNDGDLFISGGTNSNTSTILLKINDAVDSNGDVCLNSASCDQFYWGNLSGVPGRFTEIAESPISGTVDLADPSSGAIEVFDGENLTYIKTLPLTFDNYTAVSGIPQPFSQQANVMVLSGDLNITKWLTDVGLFGIKNLASNPNSDVTDQEGYHHPLAITDVNGYTYVLDDWSGNAEGNNFNILMLRILSNGTSIDVPVNPSLLNDVSILTPREKAIINFDSQGLQFDYPPYGIILSANVSGINFCSSTSCKYSQSDINSTYYPTGPELNQSFIYNQHSLSNSPEIGFSVSTDGQMSTFIPQGSNNFKYGELLFMDLNPVNYTGTISGLPPHECYLSVDSPTCEAYDIDSITPPIYATGDIFKYLENRGSQSALSYTVQYNSQFATSNTPNSGLNQTCIGQLSNFSTPTSCYSAGAENTIPYTYNITSAIQGNILQGIASQQSQSAAASSASLYSILQSVVQTLAEHMNIIHGQPFLGNAGEYLNASYLFLSTTSSTGISANTTKLLESQISLVNEQENIIINETKIMDQGGNQAEINSELQTLGAQSGSFDSASTDSSLQTLVAQNATNNTKAMTETLQTTAALETANNTKAINSTLQTLEALAAANDTTVLNETKIYFNQLLIFDVEKDIELQELSTLSSAPVITGPATANSSEINPPITKLTSLISGQAIVAYEYHYTTFQWWGPFITITPQWNCPFWGFLPFVGPVYDHYTTYAYSLTPFTMSTALPTTIQGGPTYLLPVNSQTNSSYYLPTLADTGLYLSQHILFNLTSDRSFGRIYVANSGLQSNNFEILNATQQNRYIIQTAHVGNSMSYEAISTNAIGPNYGSQYSGAGIQATDVPSSFLYNETLLTPPFVTNYVTPTEYTTALYSDRLYLYLPELLGYQRLVYAFTDDFNNTIYAPLDVDIVRTTSLLLNATPVVNVTNTNKTTLFITGRAGELSYNGFFPNLNGTATFIPLPNASVYLYYNHNINYVGLNTEQDQLCAFGNPSYPYNTTPFPSNCTLANPNYIGKTQDAGNINYNPQYNSSGFCAPPPNSLIKSTIDCNIYGEDNFSNRITASCPTGANNNPSYCIPLYLNGSGICTTQLGLIGIVKTDSAGAFNLTMNACGTGQHNIIGQYYGDSMQFATADQNALNQSADSLSKKLEELNQNAGDPQFQVLNYHWSPNVSYSPSFQSGSFALSFGVVSISLLILTIVTIAAILLIHHHRNSQKLKKRNSRKPKRKRRKQSK